MAGIMSRAAPVFEIMSGAAKTEPEIAELLHNRLQERLKNLTIFVRSLAANGPLLDGLDVEQAGEIVWAMTSPELYQLLTGSRNWPTDRYVQWLTDTLVRLLLP
jgi:hypothetical protein